MYKTEQNRTLAKVNEWTNLTRYANTRSNVQNSNSTLGTIRCVLCFVSFARHQNIRLQLLQCSLFSIFLFCICHCVCMCRFRFEVVVVVLVTTDESKIGACATLHASGRGSQYIHTIFGSLSLPHSGVSLCSLFFIYTRERFCQTNQNQLFYTHCLTKSNAN